MQKAKRIIALLLVLLMALSVLVACKPATDDEDDPTNNPVGGGDVIGDQNPDDPDNPGNGDNNSTGTTGSTGSNKTGTTGKTGTTTGSDKTGAVVNPDPTVGNLVDNPLLKKGKPANSSPKVSYDIDKTGFVKNVTTADFKGKSLTLYTSVDYGIFGYHNEKKKWLSEWEWFKELKSVYGLNIKYIRCDPGTNVMRPFQAMSSGKDIDLITTHVSSFPYVLNILRPLDDIVNLKNFANSPGLDPQITNLTKWKGKHVVLGPCATYGALWYNKTFITGCGIEDPKAQFKKGVWNWENFKKYMVALPETNAAGKTVYGMSTYGQFWYWANTNGKPCFEIDTASPNGNIKNNWESAEVKEAFLFLEGVCDAGGNWHDGAAGDGTWLFDEDPSNYLAMTYATMLSIDAASPANQKKEWDWVPWPKNQNNKNAVNHVEIYGFGIGLPRKTKNEANVKIAAKFAELWTNRFTEASFDGLQKYSKLSYENAIEYYEYGQKYGRFGLGSGVGKLSAAVCGTDTNFNKSITDPGLSTASCMEKVSNFAKREIDNCIKFGVQ